ncbi:MAG TPA: hypothetical protein VIY49_28845 [Bryobacteraceae bacterium]
MRGLTSLIWYDSLTWLERGLDGSICDIQTFAVPPYVLNAMPAGTGYVQVENFLAQTAFSVSGVEYPYSTGGNTIQVSSTFE